MFDWLLEPVVAYIESMEPIPGADQIDLALASFPSTVFYFIDIFSLDTCFGFVMSAFLVRFLIRRIPIIG